MTGKKLKTEYYMKAYQREFLDFAIETQALRFGSFVLKSGRESPYFFNTGYFSDGRTSARLGRFYAAVLADNVSGEFMLFGPAYKGIPLVTTTAVALANEYDINVPFAFNRKEAKDHGEGGQIVGAALAGNVVIVDDVISAGLSVDQSVEIIRANGAVPSAVVITLDRKERVPDCDRSAVDMVAKRHQLPVYAIADLDDLVEYLARHNDYTSELKAIESYRARYGGVT